MMGGDLVASRPDGKQGFSYYQEYLRVVHGDRTGGDGPQGKAQAIASRIVAEAGQSSRSDAPAERSASLIRS